MVLTEINGKPAVPFRGVGKYKPTGNKAAPPIRSCNDYPADGSKVVADARCVGCVPDAPSAKNDGRGASRTHPTNCWALTQRRLWVTPDTLSEIILSEAQRPVRCQRSEAEVKSERVSGVRTIF